MAGIVYAVSGIVLLVAFPFAFHYWQEQRRPKIGQSKKKRFRIIMRRWTCVSGIACVITLLAAGVY